MSTVSGTDTPREIPISLQHSLEPPPRLVRFLAMAAGLSVAPLYYSQPMLGALAADIGATPRTIGMVPMLAQLGYAFGILLLAPLGDRFDRRSVILAKAAALCAALMMSALAPSIGLLLAASLFTGMAATLAQDIVPAAATLAPDMHRGKIVGNVMTGLLLGILLSRVVSGLVAEHFGWRAMFAAAAVSVAAVGLLAKQVLPRFAPTTSLSYGSLLRSLLTLWQRHSALRRATVAQALISVGFSAFWSTLAIMLRDAPFHLGSAAAGAFGIAGAAGALFAPLAGRMADRRGPHRVALAGTGLAVVSFAAMALGPLFSVHGQLALLAVCAVGFDLGAQVTLISHQTIVYGTDASARSRLNAVLFVGMFIGMAIGAGAGGLLYAQWGWTAVTGLATISAAAALGVRLWSIVR